MGLSKGSLLLVKVNFGLKRPLNDSLLVASWLRFQPQILAASQLVPQNQLLFLWFAETFVLLAISSRM